MLWARDPFQKHHVKEPISHNVAARLSHAQPYMTIILIHLPQTPPYFICSPFFSSLPGQYLISKHLHFESFLKCCPLFCVLYTTNSWGKKKKHNTNPYFLNCLLQNNARPEQQSHFWNNICLWSDLCCRTLKIRNGKNSCIKKKKIKLSIFSFPSSNRLF